MRNMLLEKQTICGETEGNSANVKFITRGSRRYVDAENKDWACAIDFTHGRWTNKYDSLWEMPQYEWVKGVSEESAPADDAEEGYLIVGSKPIRDMGRMVNEVFGIDELEKYREKIKELATMYRLCTKTGEMHGSDGAEDNFFAICVPPENLESGIQRILGAEMDFRDLTDQYKERHVKMKQSMESQ